MDLLTTILDKNPNEPEFQQAVKKIQEARHKIQEAI